MRIISVNIGEPKTITWRGKKVKTGIYKYPVESSIFLKPENVEGNSVIDRRYHGGNDKACYSYSYNHYDYWKKHYPKIDFHYGIFGENLTVENLDEADINIGDIFQIGEAEVQVTQPRQPCFKLGVRFGSQKIIQQFIDSGFPGVYFRVLKQGKVKTGNDFLLVKKQNAISVQKIFELLYSNEFQKEEITKAINNPDLAQSCRKDLLKRWNKHL